MRKLIAALVIAGGGLLATPGAHAAPVAAPVIARLDTAPASLHLAQYYSHYYGRPYHHRYWHHYRHRYWRWSHGRRYSYWR